MIPKPLGLESTNLRQLRFFDTGLPIFIEAWESLCLRFVIFIPTFNTPKTTTNLFLRP